MIVFLEVKVMEDKLYKTKESIAEKFDLPRDIILNLPKITIISNNEITIENHKGVVLFEDKEVKINSNVGLISISGRDFEILFMGGSTLTLSGKFKSVVYEGNE
jgi:sporulation protein YqfC